MGGYECSDKLNKHKQRVDLLQATGHLQLIDQDYQSLSAFNIQTVREGIRWSFVEKEPYRYDWSIVELMIDSAKRHNIQQIWDICHFGFPDDLNPLSSDFAHRFSSLCEAFVIFYRSKRPDSVLIVTPINEVSYLAWLGGDDGNTVPYFKDRGKEVKCHLMEAYIKGVEVMRAIDPSIRILTTEPIVNMVPPLNPSIEEIEFAFAENEFQFNSLDILSGKMHPELGGKPEYLDILGFNFYYNNQWVVGQEEFLPWANLEPDERWLPLSDLLISAYERYQRPFVVTETSHSGIDRPQWISFIAEQCQIVLKNELPLLGVCLYPIIDRPDWDNPTHWHHSGLWDNDNLDTSLSLPQRLLFKPYSDALLNAMAEVLATNDRLIIARSEV
ncbi:MAG: amine oxidase [Sphingobacteriales bacterium]|nr:amine oxidase [Sphingobacteriales bacterium]